MSKYKISSAMRFFFLFTGSHLAWDLAHRVLSSALACSAHFFLFRSPYRYLSGTRSLAPRFA